LLVAFAFAGAVFQTAFFAAFAQVGVTVTVAVVVCVPVVLVAAGEALWCRRRPEPGVSLAIATASAGAILATLGGGDWNSAGVAANWRGIGLLATASLSYAIVVVTARAIGLRLHPLHGTGLGLGLTAVALALCVLVIPRASVANVLALPGIDLVNLAYTGVVATGGAYLAFVLGMRLSRSAAAGLAATLIEPGIAALLAVLVLGERLANLEAAGCALMFVAMVVLFRSEQRAEVAAIRRRVDPPLGKLSHDGAS
jgi:DME family drug/metabolite transporter